MKSSLKSISSEKIVRKPLKRTAAKVVPKKPTLTTSKTAVRSKTKTKSPKAKSTDKSKLLKTKLSTKVDEEVKVPSVASMRLLEKVEIYRLWYKNDFSRYMSTTAKVGGYVFILLGTLFTSASYLLDKNLDQLSAAIVCSQENCLEIKDENLPPGSPMVSFLSSIPKELTSDADIDISFENSPEIKVLVKDNQSGELTAINSIDNINDKQKRYLVLVDQLPASSYQLFAEVKSGDKLFKFMGPTFVIPTKELETPTPVSVAISSSTTDITSTTTPKLVEEETTLATSSPEVIPEAQIDAVEPSKDEVSLNLKQSNEHNYLTIRTGNLLPSKVEVYARLESAEDPLYLGLATFVQDEWTFSLSALDLPNVNFLLFASFVVDGEIYLSEGALYTPVAQLPKQSSTDLESQILANKINLALETSDTSIDNRSSYFSTLNSSTSEIFTKLSEENYASKQVIDYANLSMNQESSIIDSLLLHFASAIAGEDEYLIKLAENQFANYIRAKVSQFSNLDEDKSLMTTLETVLSLRLQLLKAIVLDQESKLKSATSGLTAKDIDKDGLPDLDESLIYYTDPTNPDSDLDTVLDGIEIVTNTNPQMSDLVRLVKDENLFAASDSENLLNITSVDPLIANDSSTNNENVYAVVNGTSIPNTFVTIFFKQLNTKGIIKTNDSGDFSYTFEKPLDDGLYEIIAVIGDANGNPAALSQIFKFTKKSNDFLAAAASTPQPYFEQDDKKNLLLASTITAAITLVTFGFILLLLGQIIRHRKESLEESPV